MQKIFHEFLEAEKIRTSAPCRIDMGGTLDIRTFYLPLRHYHPCTFNIAINLRTRVQLLPFDQGYLKISSRGFDSAIFRSDTCPFDTPLGLMFAIATYFGADGVHIDIDSASPPRSAMGGSSAAAVALISALGSVLVQAGMMKPLSKEDVALLAHALEESVAGIPCGIQDHLAAIYGGVNAWYWPVAPEDPLFTQKTLMDRSGIDYLQKRLLIAYAGIPHESKNINTRWVQQFISAETRMVWREIITCTHKFVQAIIEKDDARAVEQMNHETDLRCQITPDVLDEMGKSLVEAALANGCGARFTGAGGGGCIWALGEVAAIENLKGLWQAQLQSRDQACLLQVGVTEKGLKTH
jgi:D-glycero-alpha-D-manno-heptose-7-phosphate kinase